MNRVFLLFLIFFVLESGISFAFAHIPVIIEPGQANKDNPFQVRDSTTSMAYYDVIGDSPKYYQVAVTDSRELYVNLSVPKTAEVPQCTPSVLVTDVQDRIIYQSEGGKATWIPFHEPFGNAHYFRGAEVNLDVIPGPYLITISNDFPDCKYTLATGTIERFETADFISSVFIIPVINQNFFEMNPIQSVMNMSGLVMIFIGIFGSIIIFVILKLVYRKKISKIPEL